MLRCNSERITRKSIVTQKKEDKIIRMTYSEKIAHV